MKHIKLFEAFASKSVSAIEKFLKQLNNQGRDEFVNFLKTISERRDIPLSNFKGEYVKSLTAIKMNIEGQELIKFWFSIEEGFIGATLTKRYSGNLEQSWMRSNFIKNFIANNVMIDEYLRESSWRDTMCENILDSQFALVINITELSKGLKDLKDKRKENKKDALSLFSDDYIRLSNQRKRKDILQQKRGVNDKEVMDLMFDIMKKYRCHDPMDILDVCFELYYRGKMDRTILDRIHDYVEERWGDQYRFGSKFGAFGGGFSRRFDRGYGDPWSDNHQSYDYF